MRRNLTLFLTWIVAPFLLSFPTHAVAGTTEQIIYAFQYPAYGQWFPTSQLVYKDGIFYGLTSAAGGGIYSLAPDGSGGWTYTNLHVFTDTPDCYYGPNNIVFDSAGNIYGETIVGGAYNQGCIYELSPVAGGGWSYQVIFSLGADGIASDPAGLAVDAAGNLYGTSGGGTGGNGTVFELTRGSDGTWSISYLHLFDGTDGTSPNFGLNFDASGNLFGSTSGGGAHGYGAVFELTPSVGGAWTETTLSSFTGSMGNIFNVMVAPGNKLYGTTYTSRSGGGIAFELAQQSDGSWLNTTLHEFNPKGGTGYAAVGTLTVDAEGNVYGTTEFGGAHYLGTAYKLSPTTSGHWNYGILHSFGESSTDGFNPIGGVTFALGSLFGTTAGGDVYTGGTAWEIFH